MVKLFERLRDLENDIDCQIFKRKWIFRTGFSLLCETIKFTRRDAMNTDYKPIIWNGIGSSGANKFKF